MQVSSDFVTFKDETSVFIFFSDDPAILSIHTGNYEVSYRVALWDQVDLDFVAGTIQEKSFIIQITNPCEDFEDVSTQQYTLHGAAVVTETIG